MRPEERGGLPVSVRGRFDDTMFSDAPLETPVAKILSLPQSRQSMVASSTSRVVNGERWTAKTEREST